MKRLTLFILILSIVTMSAAAEPDTPCLEDKISIDTPETLFTTFAFITIAKFDTINTDRMIPLKQFVWKDLDRNLSPSYKAELRAAYDSLENRMFAYRAGVFSVLCSEPPHIRLKEKEMRTYYLAHEKDPDTILSYFDDVQALPDILNRFYETAAISRLWDQVQPWYNNAVNIYEKTVYPETREALAYLGFPEKELCEKMDRIRIIPHLIGTRGNAYGPTWCGVKYDIHTPWSRISWSPHEFIHNMVADVTRSGTFETEITAIVDMVWEGVDSTSARKYYSEKVNFFDECLVRTLDHVVNADYKTAGGRAQIAARLENQAGRGFVLCVPMHEALDLYEKSGKEFSAFFPEYLAHLETVIKGS